VRPFAYVRPEERAAAVALVTAERDARYLGGGTNLIDLMKLGVAVPHILVDVSRLLEARVEEAAGGGLRIGAGMRNGELAADRRVRERYPAVAQALLAGACGQLRNLATVGGNLLQRTRCTYFQDVTKPCNKRRPGSGCSARTGDHRGMAILGVSPECIATHPSDLAVALAAFDAIVHTSSRSLPLTELQRLAGDEPERDSVLDHGELILAVELPRAPGRSSYRKVRDRASFSFALVSIAVVLEVADGQVREVRIALGGVAHKPWRAFHAERALRGGPATAAAVTAAADAELAYARPLRDNAFKVALVRDLIVGELAGLGA
jgi:xanthine dehydrogenase YagS FAD-binding subunit